MKKLILMLLAVTVSAVAYALDKYSIDRSDLPPTARDMLEEYFPNSKVSMIKVDNHMLKKTDYDVKLVNGTKIEFNSSGLWTSVDCKSRAVPSGLILRPIRTYVKNNYAGKKVVSITRKANGYDIGLSNGAELSFNLLGQIKKSEPTD